MSYQTANLLSKSPFDSLADAANFLEWYAAQPYHTAWDDYRADFARQLAIMDAAFPYEALEHA